MSVRNILIVLIPILLVSESTKYLYLWPNHITEQLSSILGYPNNLNQTEQWKIMPITNSKLFNIESQIPNSRNWVFHHLSWSIALCIVVWICIVANIPFGSNYLALSFHIGWMGQLLTGVSHFLNFDKDTALKINWFAIIASSLCLIMHHVRFQQHKEEDEKQRKLFWTYLYVLIILLPTFLTLAINMDILILKKLYWIYSLFK